MAHDLFRKKPGWTVESAIDEIQSIIDQLKSQNGDMPESYVDSAASADEGSQALLRTAKRTIKIRASRRKHLPEGYFEEPAYNILLDLYVAHAEGRVVYVNDACIASNAPTSTALRWISILVRDGFAERFRDEKDARRTILQITPAGDQALGNMLKESNHL